eukprot:UN23979
MMDPQVQSMLPSIMQAQQSGNLAGLQQQFGSNPVFQRLAAAMQRLMGGGSGMGGMGGMGAQSGSSSSTPTDYTEIKASTQMEQMLSKKDELLVIDFTMMPGCAPCARIKPVFTELAKYNKNDATFLVINVKHARGLCQNTM